MVNFWFQIYSDFSGQTPYESFYIAVFNVIGTFLPVALVATLNQDVSEKYALDFPELYKTGQVGAEFSLVLVIRWLLDGLYQSLIVFGSVYFLFSVDVTSEGKQLGLWAMGILAYMIIVVTVNVKLALYTTYWHWSSFVVTIGSVIAIFLFGVVYAQLIVSPQQYWLVYEMWPWSSSWLSMIISVVACIIPTLTLKYIARQVAPRTVDIIAEREYLDKKVPGPVVRPVPPKKPAPRMNFIGISEESNSSKYHTGFAFDAGIDESGAMQARLREAGKKKKKKGILQRGIFNREKKKKEVSLKMVDLSSSSSSE